MSGRAEELSGLGRWPEAVAEYRRHLAAHPDDLAARTGLGIALRAVADTEGAVAEFDRVLAADPDRFPARYQRALALAALDRDREAVADLDRLVSDHPDVWYLWSDRGGLHAREGDLDTALRDLTEAVRLAPDEVIARFNLGLVLVDSGRLVQAHHHLAHAARLGSPDAAQVRDEVRRTLLAWASEDDLERAVGTILDAGSANVVAAYAEFHPFVLAEAFVDLVDQVAGDSRLPLSPDAWRRVEDLRLLADDTPGEVSQPGHLLDRVAELHARGEYEAAYALAPRATRLAEEEHGTGSVQHARQLGSWAVLALRVGAPEADDLVEAARGHLSRVDPSGLVRLLVSLAAMRPEADRALDDALAVVRDPAAAVDAEDVVRVHRAQARRLSDAGRHAEAEDVLREVVDLPGVAGDQLADLCTAIGEAVFHQERPADAVPWCERALALRRAEHGETHALVAAAMRDLGRVYRAAGDPGSAESWARRAAAVWRRLPGHGSEVALAEADLAVLYAEAESTDEAHAAIVRAREADPDVPLAATLNTLAHAHYRAGRDDEALALYREALDIVETTDPDNTEALFSLRHNVANTLRRSTPDDRQAAPEDPADDAGTTSADDAADRLARARARLQGGTRTGVVRLLREALDLSPDTDEIRLELAEALLDEDAGEATELLADVLDRGDQQLRGRALAGLAAVARLEGDLPQAITLLSEAVALADRSGSVENQVSGRQSLALSLVRANDLDQAYATAKQAVTLALGAFGPDAPLTATAELTHARVLSEDGRHTEAEPVIRRAVAALERRLRPDDPALVSAFNDLAHCLLHQGEPHRAVPWFRRALAVAGGRVQVAVAQNLAMALADLGDFASARALAADAAARVLADRGPDHARYGAALAVQGQIALADLDPVAAADHLVAACRILDTAPGADARTLITARGNLAELYLTIGATETALSFAVAAESAARARYGPDNPQLAPSLSHLARCRAATGAPDEAQRLYREALDLVPRSRAHLVGLAELLIATGAHDEAFTTLERLVALEDADLPGVLSDATGTLRTAHFTRLHRTVTNYLNLVLLGGNDPRLVRRAWELSVRRRGLDAEYLELRATAPKSADARRELARVAADISRAVLVGHGDDLPRLRARHDELERLLAARVPGAALAARIGSVDADAVLAALPPDTTLVDVVRAESVDYANSTLGAPPADPRVDLDRTWRRHPTRYLAFVVSGGRDVRMVDLGPTGPVDDLVKAVRRGIYRRSPDTAAADALRAALAPVLDHVTTERLLVTAEGPLAQVPWQVLPARPDRLLLDDHTVSYLSTPREVLRWRPDGPTTAPLVVGDPDFDLGAPPGRLDRLAATRTECAEIGDLLAVEPLLDRAATKAAVLAVRSPTVLHLATHGLFLPPAGPPERDDVYETINLLEVPGEGTFVVDARRHRSRRPDVEPLLSSAVALAGFNAWMTGRPTPPEVDTGALTAQEVCAMDLRGTRLVVLSACETGLGDHSPGEGVLGLRWALRVAGARTVVTALWKVPDESTRELMVLFYRRLLAGDPAPEALRTAQRTMRDSGLDIAVWGAFVLHGRPTGILTTTSWP